MRFGLTAPGTERSVRFAPPGERFSMKTLDRLLRKILWILPTVLWPAAVAFAQPQSHAPASSQSSTQSSSQMQSQPPQKEEPASDAAKRAEKEKAKPKKVYTEEDLAGLRGNGVSVVGEDKPAGPASPGTRRKNAKKENRQPTIPR